MEMHNRSTANAFLCAAVAMTVFAQPLEMTHTPDPAVSQAPRRSYKAKIRAKRVKRSKRGK